MTTPPAPEANPARHYVIGTIAVIFSFCLMVAWVGAPARLLNQCLNLSMGMAVVLLLVPGVNLIGLVLLAVSGGLLLARRCTACEPVKT
jgi:predicted tellurium resistance membrane protein TerC